MSDHIIPASGLDDLRPGFAPGVNCKVLPRAEALAGMAAGFNALAVALKGHSKGGAVSLSAEDLAAAVRDAPKIARDAAAFIIENDMMRLKDKFNLRLLVIERWARGVDGALAFHADGATFLHAGYTGPMTGYVRNGEAARRADRDVYDLLPGAKIRSFRPGDIWCQAGIVEAGANPFIHNGPRAQAGGAPRLLLQGRVRCAPPLPHTCGRGSG